VLRRPVEPAANNGHCEGGEVPLAKPNGAAYAIDNGGKILWQFISPPSHVAVWPNQNQPTVIEVTQLLFGDEDSSQWQMARRCCCFERCNVRGISAYSEKNEGAPEKVEGRAVFSKPCVRGA
jgi:hypothetical protein